MASLLGWSGEPLRCRMLIGIGRWVVCRIGVGVLAVAVVVALAEEVLLVEAMVLGVGVGMLVVVFAGLVGHRALPHPRFVAFSTVPRNLWR